MRSHLPLLHREHRLNLRALMVCVCVEVPQMPPPVPSSYPDPRSSVADGDHRPRAQDLLGVLVIALGVVALVGYDQLHGKLGWQDLLEHKREVRRVVRRTSPELHRDYELLPRLHCCGLLHVVASKDTTMVSSNLALPVLEYTSVISARGCRAEPRRVDGQMQHAQSRLHKVSEEEALQPPRVCPLGELLERGPVRHSLQSEFIEDLSADLEHLAEVPVRLPEVLAERQQDHMLVVRVQMIRILRPSKRVSSPLQDPLLTTNDANQFMLVRFLPIPRHEAIPSLGAKTTLCGTGLSPGWGHIVSTFLLFQNVAFQRVSTEHRLGKDLKGENSIGVE